jgi:hypothetical protein
VWYRRLLLAVVHAAGGCGGYGDEPAAPGIPTGPGTRIPGLFPPATLPSEYTPWCTPCSIYMCILRQEVHKQCWYRDFGNKTMNWKETKGSLSYFCLNWKETKGSLSHFCLNWKETKGSLTYFCLNWKETKGSLSYFCLNWKETKGSLSNFCLNWKETKGSLSYFCLNRFNIFRCRSHIKFFRKVT